MPTGWKCEICEISKIIEKTMVFQRFSVIFGVHEHGKSKKTRYFWILSSLGLFFCWKFEEIPKKIGKIAKQGGPEAPKGWPGTPKDEKNHWLFVDSPNFWGLGASLSIIDTKKTKKTKLVGNWGSNTPLGRRIMIMKIKIKIRRAIGPVAC